MKIKTRKGVFETNSSSTHSICITENRNVEEYPSTLYFSLGEFGWEGNVYRDVEEKASYLYTALVELGGTDEMSLEECKNWIYEVLGEKGIDATFQDPKSCDFYYIDHCGELREFVSAIIHSRGRLVRYLFSEESFIVTGNDKDPDSYRFPTVAYDYKEYYKGN